MHCVAAKFVPRILTAGQKQQRVNICTEIRHSSPPIIKPSCPGSSLVKRAAFMVTTLRQSDNPPSGKKALTSPRPKKAGQMKRNVKSLVVTFFDVKGIVQKRICPNRPNCEFQVQLRRFAATA
jgi:hypothetical protein